MRVLHVVPSLAARTGGPATAVLESARALVTRGVEVSIFATDMAATASAGDRRRISIADLPETPRDLDIHLFPVAAPRRLAFSPGLARALAMEVHRYDVVHIHSLYLHPQFAAFRAAMRAGIPYIVSPRGSLDPYLRRRSRAAKSLASVLWQRRMLAGAAALHLTSDEEARLVADVAPGVARCIVPNGLHCAGFATLPQGSAFRARHGIADDERVVLYFGRLSHKKGLDTLIRAFATLRATAPCRLVIAGPDDEHLTPRLAALATQLGVADGVTFAGMQSGEARLEALAAADVWALPSHTENFGNAVVEAMAAGLPVVISPAVNIAPEIAAAAAGVVAAIDPAAFAREIGLLLNDDARRRDLSGRGREFAWRYDWSAVTPHFIAMYETAIAGAPADEAEVATCA